MATKKRSAVLDEDQVREILLGWATGQTTMELAAMYDVSRGTIYKIVQGETWKHVDRSCLLVPRYPLLCGTLAAASTLLVQDVLRGAA